MKRRLRQSLGVLLLVAVWEGVCLLGPWPPWIFPGPAEVVRALVRMGEEGQLLGPVALSIARLLVGYGLSMVVGLPLGFLLGRSEAVEETVGLAVLGLQSLPSVCWVPIAILWFGLSEGAVLFVVVMGCAMAIALASCAGVRNLNPAWIRAGRNLGARGVSLYTRVLFPASLPALVSGARLGWSFAWRSLMGAELLSLSGGLGQLLHHGRELNDTPRLFAVLGIILLLGFAAERSVFGPCERWVRRRFGMEWSG